MDNQVGVIVPALAAIPGGEFLVGVTRVADERPVRWVRVGGFR